MGINKTGMCYCAVRNSARFFHEVYTRNGSVHIMLPWHCWTSYRLDHDHRQVMTMKRVFIVISYKLYLKFFKHVIFYICQQLKVNGSACRITVCGFWFVHCDEIWRNKTVPFLLSFAPLPLDHEEINYRVLIFLVEMANLTCSTNQSRFSGEFKCSQKNWFLTRAHLRQTINGTFGCRVLWVCPSDCRVESSDLQWDTIQLPRYKTIQC